MRPYTSTFTRGFVKYLVIGTVSFVSMTALLLLACS